MYKSISTVECLGSLGFVTWRQGLVDKKTNDVWSSKPETSLGKEINEHPIWVVGMARGTLCWSGIYFPTWQMHTAGLSSTVLPSNLYFGILDSSCKIWQNGEKSQKISKNWDCCCSNCLLLPSHSAPDPRSSALLGEQSRSPELMRKAQAGKRKWRSEADEVIIIFERFLWVSVGFNRFQWLFPRSFLTFLTVALCLLMSFWMDFWRLRVGFVDFVWSLNAWVWQSQERGSDLINQALNVYPRKLNQTNSITN